MLLTLELPPKIRTLPILMPEIHTKELQQIHMPLICMRGRLPPLQLPPRSVTHMQGLLHLQQIPMLDLPLPILMPVLLRPILTRDQLLQTLTLRFKLHMFHT